MIPPEFEPIAKITVGQDFPRGDEDQLVQLGGVWDRAAQDINQLVGELNPATAATFESLAGAPAEQFGQFVSRVELDASGDVGVGSAARGPGENIALEIEYAKYMIILQLAWMAAEITYLTSTLFGSAAIPAVVAAGRFGIQTILRELFTAALMSVVMMVGMDSAAQLLQILKGDRTHWDAKSDLSAIEMGALGGAVGGLLSHGMRIVAPDFAKSLLGHVATGALTGLGATEMNNLVFNAGQSLGLGAAAGGLGGAIAHGHSLRGEGGAEHIDVPDMDIKPFTPETMTHALSGGPGGEVHRPQGPESGPGERPTEGALPAERPTEGRPSHRGCGFLPRVGVPPRARVRPRAGVYRLSVRRRVGFPPRVGVRPRASIPPGVGVRRRAGTRPGGIPPGMGVRWRRSSVCRMPRSRSMCRSCRMRRRRRWSGTFPRCRAGGRPRWGRRCGGGSMSSSRGRAVGGVAGGAVAAAGGVGAGGGRRGRLGADRAAAGGFPGDGGQRPAGAAGGGLPGAMCGNGFSRLGELGVREEAWRSRVDAVDDARRDGRPGAGGQRVEGVHRLRGAAPAGGGAHRRGRAALVRPGGGAGAPGAGHGQ